MSSFSPCKLRAIFRSTLSAPGPSILVFRDTRFPRTRQRVRLLYYLRLHRSSISGATTCAREENAVGVEAQGITAWRIRIGFSGRRGRGINISQNSYFTPPALLDRVEMRTCVCARSIDLLKAQGLCSVLESVELFHRRP